MQRQVTHDAIVLGAGLCGIWLGDTLRRRGPDDRDSSTDAASPPEGGVVIGVGALTSAARLARGLARRTKLAPDSVAVEAGLTFGIAAGLTYFSDALRAYVPGLGRERAGSARRQA